MPKTNVSDADFIDIFKKLGAAKTAKRLGITERNAYSRRASIERRSRQQINSPSSRTTRHNISHPYRIKLSIKNGVVIVGGDGHYWPGPASTAHRAFVKFCKTMKPKAVVMNGDAFDGSTISRHPPIGHEENPTVQEELEAVQLRLGEIERAVPRSAKLIWTLGNHDGRFETRLATVAAEYARVFGFHLKDHFPAWSAAWSCWINKDVVVKHRYKGGAHAPYNNTISSGKTMVTNHLHSLKVTPFNDYGGKRYGVDTGCLSDPHGPQFVDYTEDNPRDHRAGFVVLTFKKGRLLWPEIVSVFDKDSVEFRGSVVKV